MNFKKLFLLVAATLALSNCTSKVPAANDKQAHKPASEITPPLELGETWDNTTEEQKNEIIDIVKKAALDKANGETLVRRDAHPKHHGCVKASFQVDPSALASNLRVGVFSAAKNYDAWIRFSNGSPDGVHAPDIKSDVRGMAVKLMNVPGTLEIPGLAPNSQDFIMITSKEFFSTNGDNYLEFNHLIDGQNSLISFAIHHPHLALVAYHAQIQTGNPLHTDYFSSVPYKIGPQAMKFKAVPCANEVRDTVPSKDEAHPDYLGERLASTLAKGSACFDFYVQPNNDLDNQPVEDPSLSWNEEESPYIHVAKIEIPSAQDDIRSPEQMNLCENMSFNPWHTLPETRPLGVINRMRKDVYVAVSELRHQQNHMTQLEPVNQEPCKTPSTAALCETPHVK